MIKFVKIIVIFSNFRYISGVILPRKYSLIKLFKNRFYIILEIDAHILAPHKGHEVRSYPRNCTRDTKSEVIREIAQGTRTLEPLTNTSFNRANICQTSSSYNITKAIQTKNPFSLRYVEGVEPITVVESAEEKGDLEYQKRGSGIPLYEEEELPASYSYSNPSPRSEFRSSRVNPCPVWRKYPLPQ